MGFIPGWHGKPYEGVKMVIICYCFLLLSHRFHIEALGRLWPYTVSGSPWLNPGCTVTSISYQIQLRDLLSSRSGSLTFCNGQRGQRQPSNSTERSAQLQVGFTYKLQRSKKPASAIKFN